MSKMLSKMNLISVVQQLPKEDIEIIQGYVEMIEKENKQLKEQLQNISNEFLKYNWKEAAQEQIYNQLKNLYESIFKGSDSNGKNN